MSNMILETPVIKKTVEDYDFVFSSGVAMPVTIDLAAGDTVDVFQDKILIHLTAKPSFHDPDKILPAEDIKIFTSHLISIQHREREIIELTPEQKLEWKKVLHTSNGTVQ